MGVILRLLLVAECFVYPFGRQRPFVLRFRILLFFPRLALNAVIFV